MSNAIIDVQNISKRYHLGELHQHRNSFRDKMTSLFKRDGKSKKVETIWALKDVSFEVKEGEILGIIGLNGAGKSTLLKILSRITKPTKGKALINGRVGSLLEVGTGFHQELTGRENVYLNGAILGMRKAEIDKKFDEIVAFSEVDKFIDTPVKRYSSGMYVRLAFSVAAHLEPEILLVDEVLAVGDVAFQKKCVGKMDEVSNQGRTVLFVSHNMASIENLCSRCIELHMGSIISDGSAREVTTGYLEKSLNIAKSVATFLKIDKKKLRLQKQNKLQLVEIQILNPNEEPLTYINSGDSFILRMYYRTNSKIIAPAFIVSLKGERGQEIVRFSSMPISGYYIDSLDGTGYIDLHIDALPINSGFVHVDIGLARANVEWLIWIEDVIIINVQPKDVYGSGFAVDQSKGLVTINHRWSLHR